MTEMTYDFTIRRLGEPRIASPIHLSTRLGDLVANYVTDEQRVIYRIDVAGDGKARKPEELLEKAGPRQDIYFDPTKLHAGLVTCGGLCPGLNNVIRSAVMTLWHAYGVRRISGIRYGYRGLLPEYQLSVKELNPDEVIDIHRQGGTILGSSRGGGDRTTDIVDAMERMNMNVLFTIGGDGTQRGALDLAREVERRGRKIAVVGIPKTIDNDLSFVEKSFGFETAVSRAVEAVASAHTEADNAIDGIGIVKVMGRESGFIATHTALANNDVNYVLIPEVPFELEGSNGLLCHLERRLDRRHHAVILLAEGAGQQLVHAEGSDASGNRKLGDIGVYLRERIAAYFEERGREISLKYIDPSYIIRSAPANPADAIYCARLGSNAVHAALSGRTACLVGLVNNRFVHVPMRLSVARRNHVDPESPLWRDVVEATGQPPLMCSEQLAKE
jgi:6-phosphofructokinase 1